MNMTYWMTADLPSQIKSRKEANAVVEEVRGDSNLVEDSAQETTEEGDKAVIEDTGRGRIVSEEFDSGSPTVRANGTADDQQSERALSESSMENEEKVMSYLSALPDTDLPGAITSTPLRTAKQNTLQVPSPRVPKARSLQATVEDYDTPRKPTSETIIHHNPGPAIQMDRTGEEALRNQIAELQSRLDQQELTSKTRITELETILSFTRSDLDTTRRASLKQKEEIDSLKAGDDKRAQNQGSHLREVETKMQEKEKEFNTRIQEFGEELRLQTLAKLQNQREEFERQLREADEVQQAADEQLAQKEELVGQLQAELDQVRTSKEKESQLVEASRILQQQQQQGAFDKERSTLTDRLSTVQRRADELQASLERATADAQSARREAETAQSEAQSARREIKEITEQHKDSRNANQNYSNRITDLEARLKSLQTQYDSSRGDLNAKDQQLLRNFEDQERLDQRLNTAEGRVESLESTVASLRQQLADAHRDTSKARTDIERFEQEAEDAKERLEEAQKEAERRVADIDRKLTKAKDLKAEAEARFKNLQSQHDTTVDDHEAQLDDVREKAEDAVRKAGALLDTERKEKKRLLKDLKSANRELDRLRTEAEKKAAEEQESETETSILSTQSDSKDVEIENLRMLLRTQAQVIKTMKSDLTALRKKNQTSNNLTTELDTLRTENTTLQSRIESLETEAEAQRAESDAVNKAMDERLAAMLSKVLKERSKNVVHKRDDQWVENVGKVKTEKEFMGKVLMREWGRQECGVAEENEKQRYRYQYVKRS
jgi:myosin protein heavy chain